ncbi:RNA polymerase sigma factor [Xylophilus sp. GOD-11R]|uniref:RNA polymerase sigma factor n=1 Tax=Xylophilus sp. GOD-11R TaxID=3089814 RepID=UPI00298D47B6|nr:sigma-70 family RNA polymerase sigma factor [Xylophilus sp. GOD-11R]WPB55986.1 sigma-70 family RNA polymerase sigma factor [Xylophilus sp. GOD-11R]
MPIDQNDQRLMDLMANIAAQDASSAGALKQLYDLTSSRMFGLALRVTGNREWAEDALQEAYLNIWRIAGDYRASISPPMAWMGVIVRSRSLDFLRRRNSERADSAVELDDYLQDTIAGEGNDPLDMAEASQQAVALRQCLSRLEARQREVVSLAYLRELSHSELAEQLKLPLGTVKTWIRRGLTQLRDCLGRLAS